MAVDAGRQAAQLLHGGKIRPARYQHHRPRSPRLGETSALPRQDQLFVTPLDQLFRLGHARKAWFWGGKRLGRLRLAHQFAHELLQQFAVCLESFGQGGDIGVALQSVWHDGYKRGHHAQHLVFPDWILGHAFGVRLVDEGYNVLLFRLQKLFQLLAAQAMGVAVGILAVRQGDGSHVHPFGQHQLHIAHRGLQASCVAIVDDRDVASEFTNQLDLLLSERRAAAADHVSHAHVGHGQHVELPLDQVAAILSPDFLPGLIEAEQGLTFSKQLRLGGVEILAVRAPLDGASGEAGQPAGEGAEGKHHSSYETIEGAAVILAGEQACGQERLRVVAAPLGFV